MTVPSSAPGRWVDLLEPGTRRPCSTTVEWSPSADMPGVRSTGCRQTFSIPGAELYDPVSDRFVDAPAPLGERRDATAVALPGNRVLVFGDAVFEGGKYTVDATSAEIFAIEAEFGIPASCCSQPHDVTVLKTAAAVSEWQDDGAQLVARVEAPPGALEGLEAVHVTLDGNTVQRSRTGPMRTPRRMPPEGCVRNGCDYEIPLAVDLGNSRLTGLWAWITFSYSGEAPAAVHRDRDHTELVNAG